MAHNFKIVIMVNFYKNLLVLDLSDETVYIGARVDPQLRDLVEKVSKERGMNISDFIRFLIKRELAQLGFLPEDTRKAFGILEEVALKG